MIANKYITYYKFSKVTFGAFAQTGIDTKISYAFAGYAWYQVQKSAKTSDVDLRAYNRGFSLV